MTEKELEIKTSQPSPQEFLNAYNRLFEKGYKKIKILPYEIIIYITKKHKKCFSMVNIM